MGELFERPGARLIVHVVVFVILLAVIIPLCDDMSSVGINDASAVGAFTIIACVGMFAIAIATDVLSVWYHENAFAVIFYWIFFVGGMIAMCFATFALAVGFINFFSYGDSGEALRAMGPWKLGAYVMGQSFGIWYVWFLDKAAEDERPSLFTLGPALSVIISYFSYVILIALAQNSPFFAIVLVAIPFILALLMIVMGIRFIRSCFWAIIA